MYTVGMKSDEQLHEQQKQWNLQLPHTTQQLEITASLFSATQKISKDDK